MKLLRFGPEGAEKPGMLDAAGQIRDLSTHVADLAGASVSLAALQTLRAIDPETLPIVQGDVRIGSCVASTPTFHCVGLNYVRHAAETGMDAPT
ncbi:MAG: 2-hydroxyhepta-2,4-diene-1,7-dioate isomerase, partial [Pseudomonadota bacterium]